MKSLILVKNRGEQTFARPAPDHVDVAVLVGNVQQTVNVPAGAAFVIFSADGDFYAKANAQASIAQATVSDGTGAELNPAIWELTETSSISLISDLARKVTLSYYTN